MQLGVDAMYVAISHNDQVKHDDKKWEWYGVEMTAAQKRRGKHLLNLMDSTPNAVLFVGYPNHKIKNGHISDYTAAQGWFIVEAENHRTICFMGDEHWSQVEMGTDGIHVLAGHESKQIFIDFIANIFKIASLTQHSDFHSIEAEAFGRPYPTAEEPEVAVIADRDDFDPRMVSDEEGEDECEGKEYVSIPVKPVAIEKVQENKTDTARARRDAERRVAAIVEELRLAEEELADVSRRWEEGDTH